MPCVMHSSTLGVHTTDTRLAGFAGVTCRNCALPMTCQRGWSCRQGVLVPGPGRACGEEGKGKANSCW